MSYPWYHHDFNKEQKTGWLDKRNAIISTHTAGMDLFVWQKNYKHLVGAMGHIHKLEYLDTCI